jgi:hypothetical protein
MDFKWIKGVNCLSKQTWEGWLSLWWFWTENFEHTNKGREELLACRRRAPGGAYIGEAGRPGPTGLGGFVPPLARLSSSVMISPLWLSCPRAPLVAPPKLSSTPLLALLVLPLDAFALSHVHAPLLHMPPWISCKAKLAAPHACPLHVVLMKVVERASNDASWCVHDLFNKIASL